MCPDFTFEIFPNLSKALEIRTLAREEIRFSSLSILFISMDWGIILLKYDEIINHDLLLDDLQQLVLINFCCSTEVSNPLHLPQAVLQP